MLKIFSARNFFVFITSDNPCYVAFSILELGIYYGCIRTMSRTISPYCAAFLGADSRYAREIEFVLGLARGDGD